MHGMKFPDPPHPAIVRNYPSTIPRGLRLGWLQTACLLPLLAGSARASIAYCSINNFDTVNDTGRE